MLLEEMSHSMQLYVFESKTSDTIECEFKIDFYFIQIKLVKYIFGSVAELDRIRHINLSIALNVFIVYMNSI